MTGVMLDSNILIDLFNGVAAARSEWARHDRPSISIISWIEIMAGAAENQKPRFERFLGGMPRIDLDMDIAARAAAIRRERRIKLPDAIIQASAQTHRLLLVTRNDRDFPEGMPGIHIPYRLTL